MTNNKPVKGPSDFVTDAYNVEDDKGLIDFYHAWAADYDHQMLDKLGYCSPANTANMLLKYLKDKTASVLDLGCGTGLTIQALHDQGFTNLDGIDLSADMVRVAETKNIYRRLWAADLNQPLDVGDNCYDAAISSGTFTHGHVGPEPLDEILRIIKPDGLLACTVHFDLWQTRGFETKFAALENRHSIQCLQREAGEFYQGSEHEGWFCVYRKLSGG